MAYMAKVTFLSGFGIGIDKCPHYLEGFAIDGLVSGHTKKVMVQKVVGN